MHLALLFIITSRLGFVGIILFQISLEISSLCSILFFIVPSINKLPINSKLMASYSYMLTCVMHKQHLVNKY